MNNAKKLMEVYARVDKINIIEMNEDDAIKTLKNLCSFFKNANYSMCDSELAKHIDYVEKFLNPAFNKPSAKWVNTQFYILKDALGVICSKLK